MKRPDETFFLLVVAVAVSGVSCERHEFEGPGGTKQLTNITAAAVTAMGETHGGRGAR